MLCDALLHPATPRHAMTYYVPPCCYNPAMRCSTMHRVPSRDHCPAGHPSVRIERRSTPW
eukprot:8969362-Pyramimonas_sp.AAC.1